MNKLMQTVTENVAYVVIFLAVIEIGRAHV